MYITDENDWGEGVAPVYQAQVLEFKPQYCKKEKMRRSWVPVAHTCNPSYSGGRDQED
jgi:hypothetical protein